MAKPAPRYFNRELSWLDFNRRVLEEALDEENPVLERLKFLAISASNLDEFFMVRVGGLQMLVAEGVTVPDPAGMRPAEQLAAVRERVRAFVEDQYICFTEVLEPLLARTGIRRIDRASLTEKQLEYLDGYFTREIEPLLTPMAVTDAGSFPLCRNFRLHVAVRLKPAAGTARRRYAVIPVGERIVRFVSLPVGRGYGYILLDDLIALFINRFFKGEEVAESVMFRITRNADLSVSEDSAADLMRQMSAVLDERTQSGCVRLELSREATRGLSAFLQKMVSIEESGTYRIAGPPALSDFRILASTQGFDRLKSESWPPQPCVAAPPTVSMVDVLTRQDLLMYHPYESFDPVVRFVQEAAEDPEVLAVKQILYRTSRASPVVAALRRAARNGKFVTVLVELKARFDEARNIDWAKHLEQDGVQVIYGVKGYKTHAKLTIVVRRESRGIVRYCHFGTGNYNEVTARLYADVSYLTADETLGRDASTFFNAVCGYSQPQSFAKLSAAPLGLRERLIELIESEIERKRHGQQALIMAKMNSLVDRKIIDALYAASRKGVTVRLNVRGICCLRPGVKGLSERITVVSIVDRFLEHARIFYFFHGGEERLFLSSADWMPRNLDRRLELMTPVENPGLKSRLKNVLQVHFADNVKARRLMPDGAYFRIMPRGRQKRVRSQEELYRQACEAVHRAMKNRPTMLEPHMPGGAGKGAE